MAANATESPGLGAPSGLRRGVAWLGGAHAGQSCHDQGKNGRLSPVWVAWQCTRRKPCGRKQDQGGRAVPVRRVTVCGLAIKSMTGLPYRHLQGMLIETLGDWDAPCYTTIYRRFQLLEVKRNGNVFTITGGGTVLIQLAVDFTGRVRDTCPDQNLSIRCKYPKNSGNK